MSLIMSQAKMRKIERLQRGPLNNDERRDGEFRNRDGDENSFMGNVISWKKNHVIGKNGRYNFVY